MRKKLLSFVHAIVITLLLITSPAVADSSSGTGTKGQPGQPNIYLVGMGPGDVDLITIRAQEVVRKADVVVCHQAIAKQFNRLLAGKSLLVAPEASIPKRVGLNADTESKGQRKTLIKAIRQAVADKKTVAILDQGDPMVYGRWLWCLEEFKDLNIKVEAGICLFHAACATMGQDVSYSDIAKSIIITTNDAPGQRDTIEKLSSNSATMVIHCQRDKFSTLLTKLAKKYSPETPIALVLNAGSSQNGAVVRGAMKNIADKIAQQQLPDEFMVFVGANVALLRPRQVPEPARIKGKLFFVGMGPGDPELAALRAVNVVKGSDLIINQFGFLNKRHKEILRGKEVWCPSNKKAWMWFGYGQTSQDFTGKKLERFMASEKARKETIDKVRQAVEAGKQVCILDFGDPLTYAPWCWVLREFADLKPVVVPGISSYDAANAALKKSVTQGEGTKSVIITVPDVDDWLARKAFDFHEMAERRTSMVIFMPDYMITLPDLVEQLATHYDWKTPIALVIRAGLKDERVITGLLDTIVEVVGKERLPFEHLVYVGSFLK